MNSADQLKQLYKYDFWANKKVAAVFEIKSSHQLQQAYALFAHIRASQQIWLQRIRGNSTADILLWPEQADPENDLQELTALHEQWLHLLTEKDANLDAIVSYTNSKGTAFETPLTGILHHVIIHGQHHRAQIAALLREAEITPPPTDFIFYLRENN